MLRGNDAKAASIRLDGRAVTVRVRVRERSRLRRLLRPRGHLLVTIEGVSDAELRLDVSALPDSRAMAPESSIPLREPSTRRPSERVRIRAAQVRVAADRRARVRTPEWIVDLSNRRVGDGH
jgi:hypothetical protein